MQKLIVQYPVIKIALIFILFFSIVVWLSMAFGYQTLGGYVAPITLLLLTAWLYKKEGRSVAVLGLNVTRSNIGFLPLGLLIGIVLYSVGMYAAILYQGLDISFNRNADMGIIAGGFFFFIQGVLNEELIFRGYCFMTTVEKYGVITANVIFALLFLIWHWISWNAFGDYALMLSAVTVCFGHLIFSTSLLRSGTLLLPIGIHLGNNWAVKHLATYSSDLPVIHSLFIVEGSPEHHTQFDEVIIVVMSIVWMLIVTWMIMKWIGKSQS